MCGSTRIAHEQLLYKLFHGVVLFGCTCVSCFAVLQAANIANADTILVVAFAVCTYLAFVSSFLNGTIKQDDIVIADIAPPLLFVPGSDVISRKMLARFRTRAMNDNLVNVSHNANK